MTVLGIVKTRTAEHNSKKLEHISITNIVRKIKKLCM